MKTSNDIGQNFSNNQPVTLKEKLEPFYIHNRSMLQMAQISKSRRGCDQNTTMFINNLNDISLKSKKNINNSNNNNSISMLTQDSSANALNEKYDNRSLIYQSNNRNFKNNNSTCIQGKELWHINIGENILDEKVCQSSHSEQSPVTYKFQGRKVSPGKFHYKYQTKSSALGALGESFQDKKDYQFQQNSTSIDNESSQITTGELLYPLFNSFNDQLHEGGEGLMGVQSSLTQFQRQALNSIQTGETSLQKFRVQNGDPIQEKQLQSRQQVPMIQDDSYKRVKRYRSTHFPQCEQRERVVESNDQFKLILMDQTKTLQNTFGLNNPAHSNEIFSVPKLLQSTTNFIPKVSCYTFDLSSDQFNNHSQKPQVQNSIPTKNNSNHQQSHHNQHQQYQLFNNKGTSPSMNLSNSFFKKQQITKLPVLDSQENTEKYDNYHNYNNNQYLDNQSSLNTSFQKNVFIKLKNQIFNNNNNDNNDKKSQTVYKNSSSNTAYNSFNQVKDDYPKMIDIQNEIVEENINSEESAITKKKDFFTTCLLDYNSPQQNHFKQITAVDQQITDSGSGNDNQPIDTAKGNNLNTKLNLNTSVQFYSINQFVPQVVRDSTQFKEKVNSPKFEGGAHFLLQRNNSPHQKTEKIENQCSVTSISIQKMLNLHPNSQSSESQFHPNDQSVNVPRNQDDCSCQNFQQLIDPLQAQQAKSLDFKKNHQTNMKKMKQIPIRLLSTQGLVEKYMEIFDNNDQISKNIRKHMSQNSQTVKQNSIHLEAVKKDITYPLVGSAIHSGILEIKKKEVSKQEPLNNSSEQRPDSPKFDDYIQHQQLCTYYETQYQKLQPFNHQIQENSKENLQLRFQFRLPQQQVSKSSENSFLDLNPWNNNQEDDVNNQFNLLF